MSTLKKALALILVIALTAAIAVTGTMAYLQDDDSDVNVMTLGNVKIKQHEYERVLKEDGTYEMVTSVKYGEGYKLQPFTQSKPLYPATGAITGWGTKVPFDQIEGASGTQAVFAGLNNVQDKFVLVENTGKSPAYVRTLIALENGSNTKSIIGISTGDFWTWKNIGIVEIDGNNYDLFEAIYKGSESRHIGGILPAGEFTYNSLGQVYMKNEATNEDCVALDGNKNGTYDILVLSQAVQTNGFANAKTALDTAFGESNATNVAAWFEKTEVPVTVTSAEDMKKALEAGETDIVVMGATLAENPFNGHYYKDRNIDFVDCTFTANMNWMYINDASFTNCTFDCGSDNAAVHYDELFGDLVFNNCTFTSGKIKIGASKDLTGTVTFNNCTFAETTATSIWSEMGIRVYSPAEFNDCEFNNRVVLAGSNGLPITFNSCTMNGGTSVYYVDNSDGIIRGGNIPAVTINN